jgi:hypothetical protein
MRVYGNSRCVQCHRIIVIRDISDSGERAACIREHTPCCTELWEAIRNALEAKESNYV